MAEAPKLLYVVVVDNKDKKVGKKNDSFRYTRPLVQGTLQLMGCKARHAFKISQRVFEVMRRKYPGDAFPLAGKNVSTVNVPNEDCNKEMDNKDVRNPDWIRKRLRDRGGKKPSGGGNGSSTIEKWGVELQASERELKRDGKKKRNKMRRGKMRCGTVLRMR